jgi:hypothetical protein
MRALQLAEGGDAAEVDYLFEIHLGVAKSLVGFQHDEICRCRQNPSGVARRKLRIGKRKKARKGLNWQTD